MFYIIRPQTMSYFTGITETKMGFYIDKSNSPPVSASFIFDEMILSGDPSKARPYTSEESAEDALNKIKYWNGDISKNMDNCIIMNDFVIVTDNDYTTKFKRYLNLERLKNIRYDC